MSPCSNLAEAIEQIEDRDSRRELEYHYQNIQETIERQKDLTADLECACEDAIHDKMYISKLECNCEELQDELDEANEVIDSVKSELIYCDDETITVSDAERILNKLLEITGSENQCRISD